MSVKVMRGNCGTCHWWEAPPKAQPEEGQEMRIGICCVNPPVPVMMMAQRNIVAPLRPGQAPIQQAAPDTIGIRPPSLESARCERWRPYGMLPDLAVKGVI
jgi:hypothetical protein